MFGIPPAFLPERDLPDLTGKVVFVTGANHGIGYATVLHLARRGAKVYLGSRSEEKGLAAVAQIEAELSEATSTSNSNTSKKTKTKTKTTSNSMKSRGRKLTPGKVIYHHCDLSTPGQAKETADRLIEREGRLDILINNAGLLADPAVADQIMKVNHFGTFQITRSLLPLMIKTAQEPNSDVRIVFVASDAHKLFRAKDKNIQFKTLDDFNVDYSKDWFPNFSRYCVSKLANILTVKALQRRVAEHNITCLAAHPGAVNTFSHRLPRSLLPFLTPLLNLYFVSPSVGAYNSVFAAASPIVVAEGEGGNGRTEEKEMFEGAYLVPVGKLGGEGENAGRWELQEELWETTMRILAEGSLDKRSGEEVRG